MEDCSRTGFHDLNVASRKAEEAAWRRYEAAEWLEREVGPLGISNQPSEREFISCLRNGLVLCKAINKIHAGAVPKVVDCQMPLQSVARDFQPLPAYQYFENVRNFLVAAEELKLPPFEASDLERDAVDVGSVSKVVDCVLALKSHQEWKGTNTENGSNRHLRSPFLMHSASRMYPRPSAAISSDACRRLDLSATSDQEHSLEGDFQKPEGKIVESIVKLLVDCMVDAKENIDGNLVASIRNAQQDPIKLFSGIMSTCVGDQLQAKFPELALLLKGFTKERSTLSNSTSTVSDESTPQNFKCCRGCTTKCTCSQKHLFDQQEKELVDLKALLSKTKNEFEEMKSQFQRDLNYLGCQVLEMSTAACGYYKVVKENSKLYNMVQDLKGNIRVYCRIRPSSCAESKNVIEFIGKDGSLVLLDPSKTQKDGRKVFQFNRVFGPSAGQGEIYTDTRPLIRSVIDGYNVCIFAYGQTGSGKTYTMSGPSGGSSKDMGINYLALNDLFQMSNQRKDIITYDIYVQMVEIYNEQVRDLLAEEKTDNKLEIRSCNDNGLNLPDATLRSVKSTHDVLSLMKLGEVNRAVSSTSINNRSSRSHSVLTVHVHGKDISGSSIRGCLHLIDLAGSERVEKSEVTGERLKEAQFINKSLSCLGDVITALAQRNSHIPYRNSKLTLLLQDSLGGQAKTLMFAHVSPEEESFGETISTLKFAQRVSTVELGAARSNRESREVMQLKEQVENLKMALSNKEAQRVQLSRTKEPRTPSEKTPLRLRRLSIENCSATRNDNTSMKPDDKSGMKSPSFMPRSRRLSLEGSKSIIKKGTVQPKDVTDVDQSLQLDSVSQQKNRSLRDADPAPKLVGHFSSSSSKLELHTKAPRSPTSIKYQKKVIKIDCAAQVHPLKLPETPETQGFDKTETYKAVRSDVAVSMDFQTPNVVSSTNGKGSQIRKSLRTIGKLINGPDKRSQQNMVEVKSPMKSNTNIIEAKSPPSSVARTKRRQSLTGIQAPGTENSRRSSLGGKSVVSSDKEHRNTKTPPTMRSATKSGKRWL
ncbi:kinesin-like protein KIN-14L isoform X1 [Neltuma alba]|uniref:kinesin-like protein KIN-14L isoform X1 n=1 Tax=Neltuma alba TaxID=207710 RepID=UPI0010A41B75|nr:kinesin-like protein KIN-14L isoform X1 [Prosopis alba]